MKYSLRSLMIVVTLAAVGTGVVVAWRGHQKFCLERATFHRSKIVKVRNSFIFVPGLNGSNQDEAEAAFTAQFFAEVMRQDEENASHHNANASAYQHAIWRPWERFWIDDYFPPGESPEDIDKAKSESERLRRLLNELSAKP